MPTASCVSSLSGPEFRSLPEADRWRTSLEEVIDIAAREGLYVLAEGRLLRVGTGGAVAASVATQTTPWDLALADGTVYYTGHDRTGGPESEGVVVAHDTSTGHRWTRPAGPSPAVVGTSSSTVRA